MKKRNKILGLMVGAVALVGVSIMGTMAYLTSTATVTNTFTVGKVNITLDEALVNDEGKPIDKNNNVVTDLGDAERVSGNSYKLVPGLEYTKDPTVTVKANSEDAYVRVIVSINNQADLDRIFDPGLNLTNVFKNYDSTTWKLEKEYTEGDVRYYELRYKEKVLNGTADKKLEPLFTGIVIPTKLTEADIKDLSDLEIKVVAHAIQADSFADEDAAWTAFDTQQDNN